MQRRERIAAFAGAIVLTIALPVALDQEWFRHNPYILPVVGLAALVLYLVLGVTSNFARTRTVKFRRSNRVLSLTIFVVLGGLVGVALGMGEWWALGKSKAHIAALEELDKRTRAITEPHRPIGTVQQSVTAHAPTATHADSQAPDFKLTLLNVNIFIPDARPDWTGLLLTIQIRNAGAPSIATDWRAALHLSDGRAVTAQLTRLTGALRLANHTYPLSDIALEEKAARSPLKIGDAPLESRILFYAPITKDNVMNPNTVVEIAVSDFAGREFSIQKRIGDWPISSTAIDVAAFKASAEQLSRDILTFVADRHASEPPLLRPATGQADSDALLKYSTVTVDEFSRRFGARVIAATTAFHDLGIRDRELDAFYEHPTNPIGMRTVGERIGALASRLKP